MRRWSGLLLLFLFALGQCKCGGDESCEVTRESVWVTSEQNDPIKITWPQYDSTITFNVHLDNNETLVEAHIYNDHNLIDPFTGYINTTRIYLTWEGLKGVATIKFSTFAAPQELRAFFKSTDPTRGVYCRTTQIEYDPHNPGFWRSAGIIIMIVMLGCTPLLILVASFYLDKRRFEYKQIGPQMYPFFEPQPIQFLSKHKTYYLESLWKQPIHGARIYHLNHHDITWIWFPEDDETLNKAKRILVTVFSVFFIFAFQFYWNDMMAVWADRMLNEDTFMVNESSGRSFPFLGGAILAYLLRFLVADLAAVVFRFLGRKIFANLHLDPELMLCAGSSSRRKTQAGLVINYLSIVGLVIVFVGIFAHICVLHSKSHLGYVLVWSFGPFLGALVWRTVATSMIFSYIVYRIKCTFGMPHVESLTTPILEENKFLRSMDDYGSTQFDDDL